MKSNICQIKSNGENRGEALTEAAKVAQYCDLDSKQTMQLRLMAEEIVGMMQAIAFDCTADFCIEEENDVFKLHLITNDTLDRETRKTLADASTSHKNEAVKGIMGKIRDVFESCIKTDSGEMMYIPTTMTYETGVDIENVKVLWTLEQYRKNIAVDRKKHRDEWDELEKSIIANLADNVTVSTSSNHAEIVVTKSFK